jgi:hypothetical protein
MRLFRQICILFISISLNLPAQEVINHQDIPGCVCTSLLDSLASSGYFTKARQLNFEKEIILVQLKLYDLDSALSPNNNMFELYYKDGGGFITYMKYDNTGNRNSISAYKSKTIGIYSKITNQFVLNLLLKLNSFFAYDKTLLISCPNSFMTKEKETSEFEINIEFEDGSMLNNQLKFHGINNYCKYVPDLYNYLMNVCYQSNFSFLNKSIIETELKYPSLILLEYITQTIISEPYIKQKEIQPFQQDSLVNLRGLHKIKNN